MEKGSSELQQFLRQPIEMLPATSGLTIKYLQALEIKTFWDLLNYFPFRYDNFTLNTPIGTAQAGETVSVKGKIIKVKQEFARRFKIQKATIADETGEIELVWYNQPYILKLLTIGKTVAVAGEVKQFLNTISMQPSSYEILHDPDQKTIHSGRLVPVYPEIRGLSSKTIREKMFFILSHVAQFSTDQTEDLEWLPNEIKSYNNLLDEMKAYQQVHFPDNNEMLTHARQRLSFDELFTIQLSGALVKEQWRKETVSTPLKLSKTNRKKLDQFITDLPFKLTAAQSKVVQDMLQDIEKSTPMNRFIQGDVGSGKTVVAAIGAYVSYLNGHQTLIMAPTEILAQQHYATLSKLFTKHNLKIAIQTGAVKTIKTKLKTKPKKKEKEPKQEQFDIIVGTHALITRSLNFKKVGLVVIDEQHRFGVKQRAELKQKGINPHLLTMTATPIPRTVSLTLYGELDLSVINEMPKGRLPIKTYLTPQAKRTAAYDWIKKHIKQDKIQVYIICPLIEESEQETMQSLRAATKEYEYLKNTIFTDFKVALLHGKVKAKEKQQLMSDFKEKKYDILVATSVVEVGIDVPNATIMIIEGAERFGLAQLHQLRGRVGRGDKQSYCLLFTSSADVTNTRRLEFFSRTNSGMELAEFDLKIRGPGSLYGLQQHGYASLKIADFSDFNLIQKTKHAVNYFQTHHKLEEFPKLEQRVNQYQIDQVARD